MIKISILLQNKQYFKIWLLENYFRMHLPKSMVFDSLHFSHKKRSDSETLTWKDE